MKSNVVLMGRQGTGKTYALATLAQALSLRYSDGSVRIITLEPDIEAVLGHVPCPELHWHYLAQPELSWDDVMPFIKKMNTLSVDALAALSDPNRTSYTNFYDIFGACTQFTCDRCGENLGCVDDWTDHHALALDGLTGVTKAAREMIRGASPFLTLPVIGAIQNAVEALLRLCVSRACWSVLISHIDREILHDTGRVITTVHTIGQKLAPIITGLYSEDVLTERKDGKFTWSTDTEGADTKARRLPFSDKLSPTFEQFWRDNA